MSTPAPPPTYGYPQPPPKKSKKWLWITLALLPLLLFAGCTALLVTSVSTGIDDAVDEAAASASATADAPGVSQGLGSADASGDVVLGAPAGGDFGLYTVPVTVMNSSEKRSNYYIELAVENAEGVRLSPLTNAYVSGLDPGQTAQTEATFTADVPVEQLVVRMLQVQRTASS